MAKKELPVGIYPYYTYDEDSGDEKLPDVDQKVVRENAAKIAKLRDHAIETLNEIERLADEAQLSISLNELGLDRDPIPKGKTRQDVEDEYDGYGGMNGDWLGSSARC